MIYLGLAILFNVIMNFAMKYSETHDCNRYGVTVFNYAAGIAVSYAFMKDRTVAFSDGEGTFTVLFAVVNAFFFLTCLLVLQQSIKKNGAPLTATFNRMGVLLPTVISAVMFAEIPTGIQIAGIVISLFAIVYMNGGGKEKGGVSVYLILAFATGGCVDTISKLFSVYGSSENQERFIFYTFVAALIMSIGVCIYKDRHITKKDIAVGIIVGIPNELAALLLLKAAGMLPAYLVYPCYSAGVIFAVNIVNMIVFREFLSKREYIATGIIAIALILINM